MHPRHLPVVAAILALVCLVPPGVTAVDTGWLRAVFLLDKTRSTAGAPPAQPADFEPLVARLAATGGDLAVGMIDEDVDAQLVRLSVAPPPTPPAAPFGGNALELARRRQFYQEHDMPAYRGVLATWTQRTDEAVKVFRSALERRLSLGRTGRFSPVNLALRRARLYLNEPTVEQRAIRKVCVVISDGVDTTSVPTVTFDESITLIVVASPRWGVRFSGVQHVSFESLRAAIENLAAAK